MWWIQPCQPGGMVEGSATLSNPDKATNVNTLNGLVTGSARALDGSDGFAFVVANITASVDYVNVGGTSSPPVVITALRGAIGDAESPDGPLAGRQRRGDDNAAVFTPGAGCQLSGPATT